MGWWECRPSGRREFRASASAAVIDRPHPFFIKKLEGVGALHCVPGEPFVAAISLPKRYDGTMAVIRRRFPFRGILSYKMMM